MRSKWIKLLLGAAVLVVGAAVCATLARKHTAKGRAMEVAERVAHPAAPLISAGELEAFEDEVYWLGKSGVWDVAEAMGLPDGALHYAEVTLPGLPVKNKEEAWEAPMEILAQRMYVLNRQRTFREVCMMKWDYRFPEPFIEVYAWNDPDGIWLQLQELYAMFLEHHDAHFLDDEVPWAISVFRALEAIPEKPGRRFLLEADYRKEGYAGELQKHALNGMLSYAAETGEFESFLDWTLNEGRDLADSMMSHGYRYGFHAGGGCMDDVTSMGLSLLAKKEPRRAIWWASNNTLKLDFNWRAAIASGWFEYWPESPENVPRLWTREIDAMEWWVRTASPGDPGLYNAVLQWSQRNPAEAKEWLLAPANSPGAEEVKRELWIDVAHLFR